MTFSFKSPTFYVTFFSVLGRLHQLLPILIEKTEISNKNNELWAEGRRDVIKAIINIIKTVGVAAEGQGQGN